LRPVRLRGQGLEKRYGRVAALRGLDFEIASGEAVALLGANGAGKSSLLRILAGLARPSAGLLEVRGTEHEPLDRADLRAVVGYVGHSTLLYGELSARENLAFAARLHGLRLPRPRLDEVLAAFSLEDVADRRASTFSRGMAQRLAIARAVIHGPGLLLLDEPFTGLDELSADRLTQQLARLRERSDGSSPSLVLVTHDPRHAVALTDRALLLHRGRLCDALERGPASTGYDVETLRRRLTALAHETESGA
jgi:heme exporter protein A